MRHGDTNSNWFSLASELRELRVARHPFMEEESVGKAYGVMVFTIHARRGAYVGFAPSPAGDRQAH
jgi:hypothetical protein